MLNTSDIICNTLCVCIDTNHRFCMSCSINQAEFIINLFNDFCTCLTTIINFIGNKSCTSRILDICQGNHMRSFLLEICIVNCTTWEN
ncbi:Uncharacterised protein [Segatella copri]|nr:Uncharacterised protein [Segatella copri]